MSDQGRRRTIAAGLARLAPAPPPAAISSGALALDWALGTGGYPRGRVVELFGPDDCGKTTLALHAVVEAQQSGTAAYIDVDHALDAGYARQVGVDLERLPVVRPDSAEQAFAIAAKLVESRAVDLLVVDSVAALTPRLEMEGATGDATAGLQQRIIEQGLRRLAPAAARAACCLLFVNQLRWRQEAALGGPETTAGGYALRLYAAVRAEVRPLARTGPDGAVTGLRVRVRVVKNRLADAWREAELEIRYANGIARDLDLAACAARCGLEGAEVRRALARNDARERLERAVRRAMGLGKPD